MKIKSNIKCNFAKEEIRFEEQAAKPPRGLISEKIEARVKVWRKHFLFVGATDCTTMTSVNTD